MLATARTEIPEVRTPGLGSIRVTAFRARLAHHSSGFTAAMGISRGSGWSPIPGALISGSSVSAPID